MIVHSSEWLENELEKKNAYTLISMVAMVTMTVMVCTEQAMPLFDGLKSQNAHEKKNEIQTNPKKNPYTHSYTYIYKNIYSHTTRKTCVVHRNNLNL